MPKAQPRTRHSFDLSRRALLMTGCAAALPQLARPATERPAHPTRKFDPQRLVEECRAAAGTDAQARIQELLARELADCSAVVAGLGAPTRGGLKPLYRSPELTILNIAWSPLMQLLPHDHNMWAVIGIYSGREDNIFWKRDEPGLSAIGATALSTGAVVPLPRDVIHSVTNPIEKLTGAIHVYGGDFFGVHRSEWDSETLAEREWSISGAVRTFERANERFFAAKPDRCG